MGNAMSTHKVPVMVIDNIVKHPNADKLEIVQLAGWECVTQKDKYKVGQMIVYVPVDSILPWELEQQLFPPGSKIKLGKSRVRSIKIRGYVSQGLILSPEEVKLENYFDGMDVMEHLGIKKYEPPLKHTPGVMQVKTAKRHVNKNFKEYTDLENFKWYNRMFQEGLEEVVISEKLHGTNARYGWVKHCNPGLLKRIGMKLGLVSTHEFCWGSRRVQIQNKWFYKGYYGFDVYTKILKQYNLDKVIPKGYVVYGEIVGDGIQKNFNYGCGPGVHEFYIFDIARDDGSYLSFKEYENVLMEMQLKSRKIRLKVAPILYLGMYSEENLMAVRDGKSTITENHIREGVVIKPTVESECSIGRKILKVISPDYYLDNDNSDFH